MVIFFMDRLDIIFSGLLIGSPRIITGQLAWLINFRMELLPSRDWLL